MSNLSNILCRASPWEAFQNTIVACGQNLYEVDVFWEWAETEFLNSYVSAISAVFQNRVSKRFLTDQKLPSLLSFYKTNCYKANETSELDFSYNHYAGLHASDVIIFQNKKIINPS